MTLQSLDATVLSIPFNSSFKHASAERAATQTLWVQAYGTNNLCGYGEGCPREYVTDESLESAQVFVDTHRTDWLANIHDVDSLINWVVNHQSDIDAHPAAWSAVELALLDLFGKERGCSVESLLGLPEIEGRFSYTAVLGDGTVRQFEAQLARYIQTGFSNFKIKLSGSSESDLGKVALLANAGIAPHQVRADANNLWQNADTAIAYLYALNYQFYAIEEPLQAGNIVGMQRISNALKTKIILDESLLRVQQLDDFCEFPEQWIINLRISKMGGLLRSLDLARTVGQRGLRLIVGAHVGETSVLTRAALAVVSNMRNMVLAQEGAFGTHLLAHDVVQSPLMFGAHGVLDPATFNFAAKPGWGLVMASPSTV